MSRLLVEHQCPQCGAPAVLGETDRLFTCGYCRVTSYLLQPDYFRYMLPHNAPEGANLLYFPYWRCRGMLFSCGSDTIHQRVVDHSRPAIPAAAFPESLGLRTQTLTLKAAAGQRNARFLSPDITPSGALSHFEQHFRAALSEPVHVHTLIGETLSMIYAPFYLDGGLTDALTHRPVAPASQTPEDFAGLSHQPPDWPVRFVPTLCPNCGWDMAAEPDALSLACRQCRTIWRAGRERLKRMKFTTLAEDDAAHGDPQTYLPFWRIRASVSNIPLKTYADFVKQANLPRVVQRGWERLLFHFWAPAMTLSPQAYLKAGCAMTLAQPEDRPDGEFPSGQVYPVKIGFKEAVSSLRIVMAALLRPRNRILPRLEQARISPEEVTLVYVPFRESSHEYIHARFRLCINKNLLKLVQRSSRRPVPSHFS